MSFLSVFRSWLAIFLKTSQLTLDTCGALKFSHLTEIGLSACLKNVSPLILFLREQESICLYSNDFGIYLDVKPSAWLLEL
jgi:hypothetical protein